MKKYFPKIIAIFLLFFAIMTFYLSISLIFDLFGIREEQGNYVLFVVWVNFISSLIYFASVYGLFTLKKWTAKILLISAILLIGSFIGFILYVNNGGIHETKTFFALIFRIIITLASFLTAYFFISKKNEN